MSSMALHSGALVSLADKPENQEKEDGTALLWIPSAPNSHTHRCHGPAPGFTDFINYKKYIYSENPFVQGLPALDGHLKGAHIPL